MLNQERIELEELLSSIRPCRSDLGFTLVEILVVVAILGILAAIGISHFSVYRQRSFDMHAKTALRQVVNAQEAYHNDNQGYSSEVEDLPAYKASTGVQVLLSTADSSRWTGSAYHLKGEKTFCFDSSIPSRIDSVDGLNAACPQDP